MGCAGLVQRGGVHTVLHAGCRHLSRAEVWGGSLNWGVAGAFCACGVLGASVSMQGAWGVPVLSGCGVLGQVGVPWAGCCPVLVCWAVCWVCVYAPSSPDSVLWLSPAALAGHPGRGMAAPRVPSLCTRCAGGPWWRWPTPCGQGAGALVACEGSLSAAPPCRDFAYVARDQLTQMLKCHVFRCESPAKDIATSLHEVCSQVSPGLPWVLPSPLCPPAACAGQRLGAA